MANYSLVIDSTFEPFSYQEMLAPVLKATQEHNLLEEQYAELESEASEWENKANAETDPETYKRYMKYAQDLETQASSLARRGLTPNSRRSLYRMKSRYNKEIKPIAEAWEERRKLQEEQRKMLASDNTLRFDTDYRNVSLDQMINNPNNTYSTLSGNAVLEQTMRAVQSYAKKLLNDPEYKSILNGQYFQVAKRSGFSVEQILMAAINDPNAPAALRNIKNQIHGAFRNNPAYDFNFVDNWINLGLHHGIGQDEISAINDGEYISAADRERNYLTRRGQDISHQDNMAQIASHESLTREGWAREDRQREQQRNQITWNSLGDGTMVGIRSSDGTLWNPPTGNSTIPTRISGDPNDYIRQHNSSTSPPSGPPPTGQHQVVSSSGKNAHDISSNTMMANVYVQNNGNDGSVKGGKNRVSNNGSIYSIPFFNTNGDLYRPKSNGYTQDTAGNINDWQRIWHREIYNPKYKRATVAAQKWYKEIFGIDERLFNRYVAGYVNINSPDKIVFLPNGATPRDIGYNNGNISRYEFAWDSTARTFVYKNRAYENTTWKTFNANTPINYNMVERWFPEVSNYGNNVMKNLPLGT